jgi:drug/metabolite transporter (DMT)-like permease
MHFQALRLQTLRLITLTTLAMLAFAGNSLLCRMALRQTGIDPVSFTTVRLVAGAVVLGLLVRAGRTQRQSAGDWRSALALFAYAAGFSWAYVGLPTATGALLLFGSVQVTMISRGFLHGERLRRWQLLGFVAACAGLVALLLPGLQTPSWSGSLLMLGAGAAWGVYSLRGRGAGSPLEVTAGNFWRAAVLGLGASALFVSSAHIDAAGLSYAVASGALTSGIGYAVWYSAIKGLNATRAAAVQLTVPVIAALSALGLLGEPLTLRLVVASVVVLGGVALVIVKP